MPLYTYSRGPSTTYIHPRVVKSADWTRTANSSFEINNMATGLKITPAILASWPVPNYVDPISQSASIEAALYATTIIMICFVIARIYVRANQASGIGADDWIIVAAAVRLPDVLLLPF